MIALLHYLRSLFFWKIILSSTVSPNNTLGRGSKKGQKSVTYVLFELPLKPGMSNWQPYFLYLLAHSDLFIFQNTFKIYIELEKCKQICKIYAINVE